jgi:hypothetical protein
LARICYIPKAGAPRKRIENTQKQVIMPTWFVGKIRYQQPLDEMAMGQRNEEMTKQKVVTESYLIDAVSYTDAEARLYKTVSGDTPDFEVAGLRPMRLADVFFVDGGDKWYKAKVVFTTDDEKTGKEKKVVSQMLINAETVKQAHERLEESLKTILMPYEITDINLTPILEVVPYEADDVAPTGFRPLAEVEIEG